MKTSWFKKAWVWFDGKKTFIGSFLTGAVMIADGINPNLMNDKVYNGLLIIFGSLFGTGIIHKTTKNETMKKIFSSIKKPAAIVILALLASCASPRLYNYQIIDRTNHLTQAADSVTKQDINRIVNFTMVQSDFDFEVKVSKTKSFLNEVSKQH